MQTTKYHEIQQEVVGRVGEYVNGKMKYFLSGNEVAELALRLSHAEDAAEIYGHESNVPMAIDIVYELEEARMTNFSAMIKALGIVHKVGNEGKDF